MRVKEINCPGPNHVGVYVTWAEDRRCSKMSFAKASKTHTVVTSVPGSGNTWIRYLVERATGRFTGSIYKDVQTYVKGKRERKLFV